MPLKYWMEKDKKKNKKLIIGRARVHESKNKVLDINFCIII